MEYQPGDIVVWAEPSAFQPMVDFSKIGILISISENISWGEQWLVLCQDNILRTLSRAFLKKIED